MYMLVFFGKWSIWLLIDKITYCITPNQSYKMIYCLTPNQSYKMIFWPSLVAYSVCGLARCLCHLVMFPVAAHQIIIKTV